MSWPGFAEKEKAPASNGASPYAVTRALPTRNFWGYGQALRGRRKTTANQAKSSRPKRKGADRSRRREHPTLTRVECKEHPHLLFALPTGVVLDDRLIISVSRGEIEVIFPGTDFRAVYYKSTGEPQLFAKSPPNGSHEFRARAWWEACQMARQLGWLVWRRSPLKL